MVNGGVGCYASSEPDVSTDNGVMADNGLSA